MLTHQTDSAEFFFRKLLGFHQNRDYEAYKGLQNVYHERRNADSVMKYSTLCEQALDSIQKDDQSDALAITHSLYNYSRQEKMAAKKSLEAEQTKWRMTLAIILVLLVIAMFAISMSGSRPTVLNYRRTIENEYSSWKQQLDEREKAVREKERELGIAYGNE